MLKQAIKRIAKSTKPQSCEYYRDIEVHYHPYALPRAQKMGSCSSIQLMCDKELDEYLKPREEMLFTSPCASRVFSNYRDSLGGVASIMDPEVCYHEVLLE